MIFKPKVCTDCGETYTPTGAKQKRCPGCADLRNTPPTRIVVCLDCGESFSTKSARVQVCPTCTEQNDGMDRCDCGSVISGRSRWGDRWGGECDRAERRASALMSALNDRPDLNLIAA